MGFRARAGEIRRDIVGAAEAPTAIVVAAPGRVAATGEVARSVGKGLTSGGKSASAGIAKMNLRSHFGHFVVYLPGLTPFSASECSQYGHWTAIEKTPAAWMNGWMKMWDRSRRVPFQQVTHGSERKTGAEIRIPPPPSQTRISLRKDLSQPTIGFGDWSGRNKPPCG